MKKAKKLFTTAILTFAMLASFAYVTPSLAEETDDTSTDIVVTEPGNIETAYFSMSIPEEYKGKFVAEVSEEFNSVTIYSKKIYDITGKDESYYGYHGGFLYSVGMSPDGEVDAGDCKTYKTVGSMDFIVRGPSDVQLIFPEDGDSAEKKALYEDANKEYEELNEIGMDILGNTIEPNVTAPGNVTFKSAKNVKGKKIKLAYSGKGVTKYQVQITDNKEYIGFQYVVKGKTYTFKKFGGDKLKKGTTYYVRVRSIGDKDGVMTYGKWSKYKKVKIKK